MVPLYVKVHTMYTLTAHIPHKVSAEHVLHTMHTWGSLATKGHAYFQDGMNLWVFDFTTLTPEGHRFYAQLHTNKYTRVNEWQFKCEASCDSRP